jgi:hypothetical protein
MIDQKLKDLIDYYLTSRNIYGTEDALHKMVELTSKENYLLIINYIEKSEVLKHELDLSMYLFEIASKEYQDLIPILKRKLKVYKDKDAIEDIKKALLKVNI